MTVKVRLPFGQDLLSLELNEGRPVESVAPAKAPPDAAALIKSIVEPTGLEDLKTFIEKRKRLLVVVNDHTRPTPSATVLKQLELRGKEVTTVIAGGSHRSPNMAEMQRILGGDGPPYGGRVLVHDSRQESSLKSLGKTSRGTQLSFSSLVFEADGIIVVGSVEPHYFAGYTGGRKFLLPGLAGLDSIVMNHSLAADERSRVLALEGNPVHEDIMEALEVFGRFDDIFSIQLVVNAEHQISYANSGHIVRSFEGTVKHANEIYVPKVTERADIVISVAKPPLDIDLYQSQKAIDNVKLAVKQDGVIILVSPCRDGVGDRGFYDLLASSPPEMKKSVHKFGYHKAVKMANLLSVARVFAVTKLPPDVLRKISLEPYPDVQAALERATELKGKDSSVLVVLDGCTTVPLPRQHAD